ncbi:hypothetical protein TRAPUB_13147 [Trametes pubescens]|uniref:Cation/H+ exchanger transmembrane domain-containing protein n=1 Tax=Trametes pubescens TaxID=154538 RepID=A0A1M2VS75_TRAPU|nr:hypothetical protein TRAPUB_13147 [Trametes pubescens]
MPTALPYEEPSLIRLLVFSSLLYLLNLARVVADFLLHGGIVAEIALGVIYGSPLAALLPTEWEETFTVLGYLGLILVVFEGGLSSNLPMLLSNLPLSIICALVGIGVPIAFAFALLNAAFGYKPLEAFAAGAALSSTSLGTTLAALNSVTKDSASASTRGPPSPTTPTKSAIDCSLPTTRSPSPVQRAVTHRSLATEPAATSLQQSRIGTVLISAAIIDDVVGLVIAAVVPALALVQSSTSQSGKTSLAWTIIQPLLSSVLIAAIAPLVARFLLRPLFWHRGVGELWCAPARIDKPWGTWVFAKIGSGWGSEKHADAVKLFLMVVTVSAMAAISYYTGTSILYGAYIAGLILTYISQPPTTPPLPADRDERIAGKHHHKQRTEDLSFEATFSRLVGPVQDHVLLPLFFASIGFAIPFLDLWKPKIIWRGIVYSILMCLAKLAVGLPILFHGPLIHHAPLLWQRIWNSTVAFFARAKPIIPAKYKHSSRASPRSDPPSHKSTPALGDSKDATRASTPPPPLPSSTPAAVFMGVAMVARGEIGLLIAQLARGDSSSGGTPGLLGEEPFLLCIWAILLCTLVGPISLGFIVRRWGARVNAGVWA